MIFPNVNFTKRQWLTLLVIGLADFFNAVCVSLQAPFFPHEAEKKGCNATEYGLVFGVFELVVFIISPIYGQYLNRIGPKVLFNGGIFTTGTSAILFGLLDKIPDHIPFITLAFLIRIVEALGNAAFLTASFAIIAKEFSQNVGVTFASLETFFGLGLIVGPMVGGALYTIGGYFMPFVVLGCALFLIALLTLCVLPRHTKDVDDKTKGLSMKSVLKIPGVLVCSFGICATSASIGFLNATLEPHLRQFNLTPVLLGVVFVINGGIYALTAPVWGWMVDKVFSPKLASLLGTFLIGIAFCAVGPVSFIPLETTLTIVIFGLVVHGLGIAAMLVSSFADALRCSVENGLPDNMETYGLISGLWTSTFALGAFIGPSVSGVLYDTVGFRKAVLFIIGLNILVGLTITIFLCFNRRKNRQYKKLVEDDRGQKKHNIEEGVKNDQNGNAKGIILFSSETQKISDNSDQILPCSLADPLFKDSYINSKTRLIRPPEAVAGINCSSYYGSIDIQTNGTLQQTLS